VHAAVPVAAASADGVTVVDLPEVGSAAAIIHHGSMDDVLADRPGAGAVDRRQRIPLRGLRPEVTLHWCPDPGQWVTELQQPIDTTGG
jgi:hypothetical protein